MTPKLSVAQRETLEALAVYRGQNGEGWAPWVHQTTGGVLERRGLVEGRYAERAARFEYRITPAGREAIA